MRECPYCHQQVSHFDDPPPQNDTGAWRNIAREHAADCDWVQTHAPSTQALGAAVASGDISEPVDADQPSRSSP